MTVSIQGSTEKRLVGMKDTFFPLCGGEHVEKYTIVYQQGLCLHLWGWWFVESALQNLGLAIYYSPMWAVGKLQVQVNRVWWESASEFLTRQFLILIPSRQNNFNSDHSPFFFFFFLGVVLERTADKKLNIIKVLRLKGLNFSFVMSTEQSASTDEDNIM